MCAWCDEPLCDDYCIDLREHGLGCFHKACARHSIAVQDLAMELLLDEYKTYMDIIESQDEYDAMWEGVDV